MSCHICSFFFFNDTATTEIYTLSLHDALPIYRRNAYREIGFISILPAYRALSRTPCEGCTSGSLADRTQQGVLLVADRGERSEEHTSELQSRQYLVCRLLLEKKNRTAVL